MRSLLKNDKGIFFMGIILLLLIVFFVIGMIFFYEYIILIVAAVVLLSIMSAIGKYVPMPYKMYGVVACIIALVAIVVYLLFL